MSGEKLVGLAVWPPTKLAVLQSSKHLQSGFIHMLCPLSWPPSTGKPTGITWFCSGCVNPGLSPGPS